MPAFEVENSRYLLSQERSKAPSEMKGWDEALCRCENNGDYCEHCLEVEADNEPRTEDDKY